MPVSRPGRTVWAAGRRRSRAGTSALNVHPTDVVSFGANYGRDTYGALQLSRNANPPPDPTWTDPEPRLDARQRREDQQRSALYLDLLRAVRNTDIRFGYDYSDSNNAYVHGGPRIPALAALNQFIPLPNVENTWQRLRCRRPVFLDAARRHRRRLLLREARHRRLQHDRYRRAGRLRAAQPASRASIGSAALNTGYGNRPYKGGTGTCALLYRFCGQGAVGQIERESRWIG